MCGGRLAFMRGGVLLQKGAAKKICAFSGLCRPAGKSAVPAYGMSARARWRRVLSAEAYRRDAA